MAEEEDTETGLQIKLNHSKEHVKSPLSTESILIRVLGIAKGVLFVLTITVATSEWPICITNVTESDPRRNETNRCFPLIYCRGHRVTSSSSFLLPKDTHCDEEGGWETKEIDAVTTGNFLMRGG